MLRDTLAALQQLPAASTRFKKNLPPRAHPRDRTQFSVVHLSDPDDAVGYWLSRPVEERLRALEPLRRTFNGYTSASDGLQRVLEVAQLELR
jgi:hypothetical protein